MLPITRSQRSVDHKKNSKERPGGQSEEIPGISTSAADSIMGEAQERPTKDQMGKAAKRTPSSSKRRQRMGWQSARPRKSPQEVSERATRRRTDTLERRLPRGTIRHT
jgi:hypothetical protein